MKSHTRVHAGRPLRTVQTVRKPLQGGIQEVTRQITACIEELTSAGYHETAAMLAIARVDLLARRHGITEDELQCMMTAAALRKVSSE